MGHAGYICCGVAARAYPSCLLAADKSPAVFSKPIDVFPLPVINVFVIYCAAMKNIIV